MNDARAYGVTGGDRRVAVISLDNGCTQHARNTRGVAHESTGSHLITIQILTRIELNSVMLPRCGAVEQGGEGQLDIVLKAVHFLSRKGRTADELGMAVSRNRSVQSDLRIQNRAISRLHAELHLHDNKVRETTSLHPYSTRRHVRHSGAACELAIQHRGIAVS